MTKPIQAYFHTENEAEDVRILLQAFAADVIEVGAVEGEHTEGLRFIVPLAAGAGSNGVGGGFNSSAAAAFAARSDTTPSTGDLEKENYLDAKHLRYVLSTQVRDDDYDAAIALIHRNNGHVQRLD